MIKRAAKLTVLQLAGAAVKCGRGGGKENVICMTIEGSTYYKLLWLKDEVEMYIAEWMKKKYNIYTQIIQVEDAVLKGAAIAGLL